MNEPHSGEAHLTQREADVIDERTARTLPLIVPGLDARSATAPSHQAGAVRTWRTPLRTSQLGNTLAKRAHCGVPCHSGRDIGSFAFCAPARRRAARERQGSVRASQDLADKVRFPRTSARFPRARAGLQALARAAPSAPELCVHVRTEATAADADVIPVRSRGNVRALP